MKIIVIGDVHARWTDLNRLILSEKPDIILSTGDFGYFPQFSWWSELQILYSGTTIYIAPGNHENWWRILEHNHSFEALPNIFIMQRGDVIRLNDQNILFMGGADSIDKDSRYIGHSWFPEEIITQKDIYNLPDIHIDVVISHTAPSSFNIGDLNILSKFSDPSRRALENVLEKYQPSLWYFSHFHYFRRDKDKDCRWTMLHMAPKENWWCYLGE